MKGIKLNARRVLIKSLQNMHEGAYPRERHLKGGWSCAQSLSRIGLAYKLEDHIRADTTVA